MLAAGGDEPMDRRAWMSAVFALVAITGCAPPHEEVAAPAPAASASAGCACPCAGLRAALADTDPSVVAAAIHASPALTRGTAEREGLSKRLLSIAPREGSIDDAITAALASLRQDPPAEVDHLVRQVKQTRLAPHELGPSPALRALLAYGPEALRAAPAAASLLRGSYELSDKGLAARLLVTTRGAPPDAAVAAVEYLATPSYGEHAVPAFLLDLDGPVVELPAAEYERLFRDLSTKLSDHAAPDAQSGAAWALAALVHPDDRGPAALARALLDARSDPTKVRVPAAEALAFVASASHPRFAKTITPAVLHEMSELAAEARPSPRRARSALRALARLARHDDAALQALTKVADRLAADDRLDAADLQHLHHAGSRAIPLLSRLIRATPPRVRLPALSAIASLDAFEGPLAPEDAADLACLVPATIRYAEGRIPGSAERILPRLRALVAPGLPLLARALAGNDVPARTVNAYVIAGGDRDVAMSAATAYLRRLVADTLDTKAGREPRPTASGRCEELEQPHASTSKPDLLRTIAEHAPPAWASGPRRAELLGAILDVAPHRRNEPWTGPLDELSNAWTALARLGPLDAEEARRFVVSTMELSGSVRRSLAYLTIVTEGRQPDIVLGARWILLGLEGDRDPTPDPAERRVAAGELLAYSRWPAPSVRARANDALYRLVQRSELSPDDLPMLEKIARAEARDDDERRVRSAATNRRNEQAARLKFERSPLRRATLALGWYRGQGWAVQLALPAPILLVIGWILVARRSRRR
jgi:hypothetical protein